jgi:hypothetical protein
MYSQAKERLEAEQKQAAETKPVETNATLKELSVAVEKATILNVENTALANTTLVLALEKFTSYLSKVNANAQLEHDVLLDVKAKLAQI